MNFCDECETCAHCLKKGCIPVQPATKEPSMSTRTVIEINHDYLGRLEQTPGDVMKALIRELSMSFVTGRLNSEGAHEFCSGIRILGQRHHSETLKLEVK